MHFVILFCAIVLIFVAILFAFFRVLVRHEKKHHLRHIVMLAGTSLGSWYAAFFLKNVLLLPRPDATHALFHPLAMYSHGLPSGHAAFMFALASTMHFFDKRAGKLLYILAFITGVARILAGVHFWYDIVAGALLGITVSFVVVTLCNRLIVRR
ncbi:MAG: hypothetical protein RIQ41_34 [Candidatus Parcubacteria bacterium]|jgi:undecaprenyl-diphosphatase